MSQLFSIGRVTADLELKTSAKQNSYLRFSLAEHIGYGNTAHTQYIQVWAWGHKLRPEEVEQSSQTVVRKGGVGVFCTKMTDPWASTLSGVIAPHYCCKAIRYTEKGKKTVQIGFVGLEDDYEICKRIYLYAYDCIQSKNKALRAARRHDDWTGKELREMCNAYGWGFCTGLAAAFQKQQEEHQEWGLIMVIPQAVKDATSHMSKPSAYTKMKLEGWRSLYASAGYRDGLKFDPGHRLKSKVS